MKCTRCDGTGKEPDSEVYTDWFPASIKPVHVGAYQKLVNGYIRYAYFNGHEWCGWCESLKTVEHPSFHMYEHPDTVNQWRGLRNKP